MLDQILATNDMLALSPAPAPGSVELPDHELRHLLRTMDRAATLAERGAVNEGLAKLQRAHQRARSAWEARAEPWGEVLATRWEWLERGYRETYLSDPAEPWLAPNEVPGDLCGSSERWRPDAAPGGEGAYPVLETLPF